jgi:hypothetical protein
MYFLLPSYDQSCIKNASFLTGYHLFFPAKLTNICMTIIILKSFIKWGIVNISFITFASQIRRI